MSFASRRAGVAFAFLLVPSVAAAQPSGTAAEPSPSPPDVAAPSAHESGLLLEIRYEQNRPIDLSDPFGGSLELPEPRGAIFAGYQLRRWSFGIGLQLARELESNDDTSTSEDESETTFLLVPGVRVALGRSSDGRAELLSVLDLGFGNTRTSMNGGIDDLDIERFYIQIGPGVRYWLSPAFAFGASALVRHASARYEGVNPFTGQLATFERAHTDLATSLSVTGVF